MSVYQILITPSAEKQIQKLPREIRVKIADNILLLGNEPRPRNSKKLKGRAAYRIRVGDYRVIYEIKDDVLIVTVVAAGHRKDIYK